MKVLIFGCGPAGLMVAHAVTRSGHEPFIFSRKRKSPMKGAQYLHRPIPGLPAYEFKIDYVLVGDVDGYRRKVYGPDSLVETSPEALQGRTRAWDIRAVYDALWASYGHLVRDWEMAGQGLGLHSMIGKIRPDLTISTIPARLLCYNSGHRFDSATVLISESASDISALSDNVVLCSGHSFHSWYRQSRILGRENTEYPYPARSPYLSAGAKVMKPISTNCDCFPEIHRMGRYGRWEKKVLSHQAYYETLELLQ